MCGRSILQPIFVLAPITVCTASVYAQATVHHVRMPGRCHRNSRPRTLSHSVRVLISKGNCSHTYYGTHPAVWIFDSPEVMN
jgi:hypothetical protein